MEELNIKEINQKMLNEAEILEEVEKHLFEMSYRIMNTIYWGYQKELISLEKNWMHKD